MDIPAYYGLSGELITQAMDLVLVGHLASCRPSDELITSRNGFGPSWTLCGLSDELIILRNEFGCGWMFLHLVGQLMN